MMRKNLLEATPAQENVYSWINSDKDNYEAIQEERLKHVYEQYFQPWANENRIKVSYAYFTIFVRQFLQEKGLTNPYVRDTKAIKGSKVVLTSDNSPEEKKFNDFKNIDYEEKFKMVEVYTKMIKDGQLNSLIVYGTPGIGKDHTIKAVLGNDARYFSGGLKGTYELVRLLYEYRDNEILVFSDIDSIFKSQETKNVLKTALEDQHKRIITYVDSSKKPKKDIIPTQFVFTSGIIIVSNLKRFDPAIKSRSVSVNMDLDQRDILKRIEDNLETFMPNIPIDVKREVFEFMFDNAKSLKHIDFRQFKFAIAARFGHPDSWKKWVLYQINS